MKNFATGNILAIVKSFRNYASQAIGAVLISGIFLYKLKIEFHHFRCITNMAGYVFITTLLL